MPNALSFEVIIAGIVEHPAVRAWRLLVPRRLVPERLEKLKENKKSAIYRLYGVGSGGSAVIAKRCPRGDLSEERLLYEQVLPRLPISALKYYGFVEDTDSPHDWLFLEDANGHQYSPHVEPHRVLAARWLGNLHTAAADIGLETLVPPQGLVHYLGLFHLAQDMIGRSFSNPRLSIDDQAMLRRLLSLYKAVESNWHHIESFCSSFPQTLAHGDFVGKNIQVRVGRTTAELLPFDWEKAGWGVAAADLAQLCEPDKGFSAHPDLPTYWEVVRQSWNWLSLPDVEVLARHGTIFRLLAAIKWSSSGLATVWPERILGHMVFYERALAETLSGVGL